MSIARLSVVGTSIAPNKPWPNLQKQNMAKILRGIPRIKLVDPKIRQAFNIVVDLLLNTPEGQNICERMTPKDFQRFFKAGDTPLIARRLIEKVPELREAEDLAAEMLGVISQILEQTK